MRKLLKPVTAVMAIVILALSLFGCTGDVPEEKTFSDLGMTITLNDYFTRTNLTKNFDKEYVSYQSAEVAVFVQKTYNWDNEYTPHEYAERLCENVRHTDVAVNDKGAYSDFEYYEEVEEVTLYNYYRCYGVGDYIWCVQFTCRKENLGSVNINIQKWADSITFAS